MSSIKPTGHSVTFDIGDGRNITIETGILAKQAHGSAVVKMGNCMVLATVVSAYEAREGQDFFPLSVDYQEKFAFLDNKEIQEFQYSRVWGLRPFKGTHPKIMSKWIEDNKNEVDILN